MRTCLRLALAGPLLALGLASSSWAGDAANGAALAKERCARCHDIAKGAGFKQRPPSFQSIAIYRRQDDIWARILSPSPHSGMPDTQWALSPEQIQDLVAYIVSLDTPVIIPQ